MEKLIMGNKNYSMLKFLYILLVFANSCTTSKISTKMETALEIDFQDFFENDKISFKFNECTIFTNMVLNSNQSTGLTSVRLKIFKKANNNYQITYSGSSIECRSLYDKIEITVILNGAANKFLIDMNAGKFIGFSKKSEADLYLNQSEKPFEYN